MRVTRYESRRFAIFIDENYFLTIVEFQNVSCRALDFLSDLTEIDLSFIDFKISSAM